MAEFIRARSTEQKAQRLEEIKNITKAQFATRPYHEITLTTIAEELGWSRANVYKYVTTKEEIFLSITADLRDAYLEALLSALPIGCDFSFEVIAEIWSGIANAHREYFRYGDILATVVETNVSVEKLAEFKGGYYQELEQLKHQLSDVLGIKSSLIESLTNAIYFHGVGLSSWCYHNPLVKQAIAQLDITPDERDFKKEMRDFILMCLTWYQEKE